MLWLKGRAAISGILLFTGFQGKAAKGGVWGSGEVGLMSPTMSIGSEAARNPTAEQDTEGRQDSMADST